MKIGVFIPIGNNGWLISGNAPQDQPSFALNRQITLTAERYGLDFVLSMIKLRGFGGKTEFWDHNLEFFTLMAGLAATACTDLGNDPPRPCLIPSWPGTSEPSIQARVPRQMARTSRAMTMWERPSGNVPDRSNA